MSLLNKVSDVLKKRHLRIATAESCTGGLFAHLLTNISGSSDYFERGVISYSNLSKVELLGVPETILKDYGAVSEQTVQAMASGIKKRAKVDIGIATTGVAGPTGGTKEKPVGLVFIGIAVNDGVQSRQFHFHGDRLQNKESTCMAALTLLLETLETMQD